MPTPQEIRNDHCKKILRIFSEYEGRYRRQDPNGFDSLKNDVFKPVFDNINPAKNYDPKANIDYTEAQETELVGYLQAFQNNIDRRVNHESADQNTRTINENARTDMNTFRGKYPKDRLVEIKNNPTAAVRMGNKLKDLTENRNSTMRNTNNSNNPG